MYNNIERLGYEYKELGKKEMNKNLERSSEEIHNRL